MALPPTGKISFSDLRTEFNDTNPVKLSDYYRGGSLVPNSSVNVGVPTSGPVSLSKMYNASRNTAPVWVTGASIVVPNEGSYSFVFQASDAESDPLTFTHTAGSLPPGTSLASNGSLTGTVSYGTYTFDITVSDGVYNVPKSFTMTVNAVPVWTSTSPLPNAQTGSYSYQLAATDQYGGSGLTYSHSGGTLPPGVSLTSAGLLTGTIAAGTYSFTVAVTDGITSVNKTFALTASDDVYAGGMGQGVPYLMNFSAPLSNATTPITIPGLGYAATLHVYLAGTGSRVGSFWAPDGYGAPQASGETAFWTYQCLGDETSFSLIQSNFDGGWGSTAHAGAPRLAFRINGGVNDGKEIQVGSAQNSGGYGAAGTPSMHSDTSWSGLPSGVSRIAYGATRFYDSTINYSDSTSYPPSPESSYGSGTTHANVYNGVTVTAHFNSGSSSALTTSTGIVYNDPPVHNPGDVSSGNQNTRPGNTAGGLILAFLNNY